MKEKIIVTIESNKENKDLIDVNIERKSLEKLPKAQQAFIASLVFGITETVRGMTNPVQPKK